MRRPSTHRVRSICPAFLLGILLLGALPEGATAYQMAKEAPTESPSGRIVINYWDPIVLLRQGGPLMWPILLCSLATITFGLERLIGLRRRRVIPGGFVRRFLAALRAGELDRASAMEACRRNASPTAAIFLAAVRHWGRPTLELDQAVSEAGNREIALLKRNLRVLQGSANIATLLGLLGTVVGMIDAFNTVANSKGLGRAELLADGIGVALLTTAFGLAVAIPSIVLANYFQGRIERLVYDIDSLAGDVVDLISAETLFTAPPSAPVSLTPHGGPPPSNSPAPTKIVPRYVS